MGFLEKIQTRFGFKGDQPPQYGNAPYHWNYNNMWPWIINRAPQSIDYRSEVGKFEDSSLVMPIINDTGIALAEAMPSVRQRNAAGKWEPVPDHPMQLLIENPNPFSTWSEYCGAVSLSWWIDGNVYFYIVRDGAGKIIEIWYLPHDRVIPRWPNDGMTPEVPAGGNKFLSHYQYNVPGKDPVLYEANDVIHLKRFTDPCDPRRGIGAFGPVIREVFGDNALAQFTATLMRNMGMVPYLLAPKEAGVSLGETQANAIKENWLKKTQGAEVGLPVVNTIPLDVTKLGSDPKDLDLSGLSKRFETRIAAVSRYPAPYLQFLAGLENGTSYASYKQAREQAYEQVIIPIQSSIAKQLSRKPLPEIDPKKGIQFYFDTSEVRVLQEDQDAKFKREEGVFRSGGTTLDQYLVAIGKDPVGSPLGDVRLIPTTSTPMAPERLAIAATEAPQPPPSPITDPNALAKFADIDRWFDGLEREMKEFAKK